MRTANLSPVHASPRSARFTDSPPTTVDRTPSISGARSVGRVVPHLAALIVLAACSEPQRPAPAPAPESAPAKAPPAFVPKPPDVLVLVLDSLRVDRMSDMRRREIERRITPNLDGISHAGATAYLGYAPSPHTAPSLMSLFTGLAPAAHGVRNVDADGVWVLDEDVPTLAERMKEAGYRTLLLHENGQVQMGAGFGRGFDITVPTGGLTGSIASLDTLLANTPADQPQFVVLHSYAAHAPFVPPRDHFGASFRGRFTEAEGTDPERGGQFRERQEALEAFEGNVRGREYADLAQGFLEPYDGMTADDLAWLADLYDENVAWVDAQIGDLIASWSRHRSYGDTLVALTASHGLALGEMGLVGNERGLVGALSHVPLVISGPGVAPGTIVTSVTTTALPATLLELVGERPPGPMTASLVPALVERGVREVYDEVPMQSLATGEYGYQRKRYAALLAADGSGARFFDPYDEPELLVETELDQDVAAGLITGHQARLKRDGARRAARPPTRAELPPRARQRLRVLGYLK